MTRPTTEPGGRVLVVDDDPTVAEVVARYLVHAGFSVQVVDDGLAAVAAARRHPPDLVVLDLMLPGLDGLEVFRRLQEGGPVPVVMLTALGGESDRLAGLELGADDYVTKPFSPRELVLRVQSVLRRSTTPPALPVAPRTLRDAGLSVDLVAHAARLDDRPLALTGREYDLLVHLLRHPRTAFSRNDLLSQVWGWDYGDASTVTVHVRRLREKVEHDATRPRRILTVFGVGYRYEPQDDA